jgi:hypothetical protein
LVLSRHIALPRQFDRERAKRMSPSLRQADGLGVRGLEHVSVKQNHLTLRSGRRLRLEGWAEHLLLPSFETHRFAMLLRARLG